jgi:hypothetical protein
MKAFRVLVPVVLAGLVLMYVLARMEGGGVAEAYRLDRESLRREMIERSTVARGLSGPAGVEEAQGVLRWWLEANAALKNRYPRQAAPASEQRGERKAKGGGGAEEAFRTYAAERAEALRAGYTPALSAAEQGLRLDLLAVHAGEHPDTHERGLRIDFALWGAPRRVEREGDGARAARRVVVPIAFRQLAFRFVDGAGKTYGEMTGSGEPYLALRDPERFPGELPPGIVFGSWWVEPFPREAARVEISVGVQVQGQTAATLAPAFRWEVPVAEEWRLRPGEAFRAETREVAPEAAPGK